MVEQEAMICRPVGVTVFHVRYDRITREGERFRGLAESTLDLLDVLHPQRTRSFKDGRLDRNLSPLGICSAPFFVFRRW